MRQPAMFMHDIFSNDHLALWIEVSITDRRTHYLRIVDKVGSVEHEIEMTDDQLDTLSREMRAYRHAKATREANDEPSTTRPAT